MLLLLDKLVKDLLHLLALQSLTLLLLLLEQHLLVQLLHVVLVQWHGRAPVALNSAAFHNRTTHLLWHSVIGAVCWNVVHMLLLDSTAYHLRQRR